MGGRLRHGWRWAVAVAAAGSVAFPGAGRATTGAVSSFRLHADGEAVRVNLPAGTFTVTVSGVYNYDNQPPDPVHLADAACSTDHRLSKAPIDVVGNDGLGVGYGTLYPSPLSRWQRYRYTLWLDDPYHPRFTTGNPFDNPLGVYIDGAAQAWVPATPVPLDGDGVDGGCDPLNHTYVVPLVSFGGNHTFQIFDTNPRNNEDVDGGLLVTIA